MNLRAEFERNRFVRLIQIPEQVTQHLHSPHRNLLSPKSLPKVEPTGCLPCCCYSSVNDSGFCVGQLSTGMSLKRC